MKITVTLSSAVVAALRGMVERKGDLSELIEDAVAKTYPEAMIVQAVRVSWRRCMGCGGQGHVWNTATQALGVYARPRGRIKIEACPNHRPKR